MTHGPYLQELDKHRVSVFFEMSAPSFSSIEVRPVIRPEQGKHEEAKTKVFYATKDGMRVCNVTFNAIPVRDLNPGVEYEYRILSRAVQEFSPYKIVMGDSHASPWYSFKTFSPNSESCSVLVMSDLHDKADMFHDLLQHGEIATCDAVFLVGDVMHHITSPDTPYSSYLDMAVEVFAKHKPFIHARGNHETRGAAALEFPKYIRCSKNNLYGTQEIGDALFVYLDTGEFQSDAHPAFPDFTQ